MNQQDTRARLSQIEQQLREDLAVELLEHQFNDEQLSCIQKMDLSNLIDYMSEIKHAGSCLFEKLMRLDAAYCQLELGLYGLCSDCESDIEPQRLSADPTEQRCHICAIRYKNEHRHELRLNH
ncbi:TraR/DksA C4-type zinc finger protein [Shewanella aestuarii]|uniref:TraR/DksA family transcriptional regulator n=1 Tax=Shewanella aestuarii TaxID=1028752 RepID=A0A6G9QJX7_9GAMM|nr:TraR/DksA C4-type zinc finger protein [Shewanella aestuarii]QIR14860.1 TraR/DksA family transcriptional regulator [Shewanella aestuarii]